MIVHSSTADRCEFIWKKIVTPAVEREAADLKTEHEKSERQRFSLNAGAQHKHDIFKHKPWLQRLASTAEFPCIFLLGASLAFGN